MVTDYRDNMYTMVRRSPYKQEQTYIIIKNKEIYDYSHLSNMLVKHKLSKMLEKHKDAYYKKLEAWNTFSKSKHASQLNPDTLREIHNFI